MKQQIRLDGLVQEISTPKPNLIAHTNAEKDSTSFKIQVRQNKTRE